MVPQREVGPRASMGQERAHYLVLRGFASSGGFELEARTLEFSLAG